MITKEQFRAQILPITLKHESGYVNDPADKGGETYRGVSRNANPHWEGWKLLERHKPLSKGDIVNNPALNAAIADLYWNKYFAENGFDKLDSLLVATQLFDFAVHGGYNAKRLQERLNEEFKTSLVVDGNAGAKTFAAINSIAPVLLSASILEWRAERFKRIIANDPTQQRFEKGWNNRIFYMKHVRENVK